MTSEPVKLLLVDDTNENLFALEAIIRRKGLEVLVARSGSDALELLLVHDVSLALLDVQMPVMDGFELAVLMRGVERTKHVPIIFVTAGSRDPQRVFKGYESGAVDFLFKPIDPHILKSKTDVFFDLAQQRREVSQTLRLNQIFCRHPRTRPAESARSDDHGRRVAQATDRRRSSAAYLGPDDGGRPSHDRDDRAAPRSDPRQAHRWARPLVRERASRCREARPARRRRASRDEPGPRDRDQIRWRLHDVGRSRLLQLFSNLVGNALRHGTRGAAISLSIAGGEREIVIRVRNGGVIPPELLPVIFEPSRGRTDSLGLFISQQIATAHAGAIGVDSISTGGTVVFTVRLPRRREHVAQMNTAE